MFTGGGSRHGKSGFNTEASNLGLDSRIPGVAYGNLEALIENVPGVKYFSIATGKLSRYLDWNNVKDRSELVKTPFSEQ